MAKILKMLYAKKIQKEITQVSSILSLAESYAQIAASRMKKIRESVLGQRQFLKAIESIFRDTLLAYSSKLSEMVWAGKLKEGGKVTFLAHNGKSVAVLISANTGFYGEVVKNTFEKFLKDIKDKDFEITIIGRLGRNLFLSREPNRPYTYFELPDYGIDRAKLSEAIKHLVQYEEIHVYYGQYISVVTQTPTTFKISAGTPVSGKVLQPKDKYIFEPNIEKILMFFETQIFASLFDQAIRESQLAKLASRILAMDKAAENIRKRLRSLRVERLKFIHKNENKKQINSLGAIVLSCAK